MDFYTFSEMYMPYICLAALAIIIIVIALLPHKSLTTREIAICAMCIALSFALSFIKIAPVPNGGSITLAAIVPLVVYSYFAGVRKGILAGFIYSFLQFIQEPYPMGFFAFILDYTLPFTVFGAVAALKKLKGRLKGCDLLITLTIAYLIRYLSHVISGALYWGVGWGASFVYSATYVPFDFIIASVVIFSLIKANVLTRLEKMYFSNTAVKNEPTPTDESFIVIASSDSDAAISPNEKEFE